MHPLALVSLLVPPLCWACGEPAGAREPLCRSCRAGLRWLAPEAVLVRGIPAWAPVAYDGPARALVRALKFEGARGVAEAIAAQIAARAPPSLLPGATLVPVPLHPARLRRRGYNQAGLIARSLARRLGLPVQECLARAGSATPQVGRARGARLLAPPGAVSHRSGSAPPRALLVDDVMTTGATIAACAAALTAAGSREVAAVAYARTPGR